MKQPNYGPYSLDPRRYIPLCSLCHYRYDAPFKSRRYEDNPGYPTIKAGMEYAYERQERLLMEESDRQVLMTNPRMEVALRKWIDHD